MLTDLNFQNYEEIIQNTDTVVIDFWAPWCGPCKALGPTIEALADKNPEVLFSKVNVDEDDGLVSRFNIRNVPTVIFIKNGKEVARKVGNLPIETYQEELNKLK